MLSIFTFGLLASVSLQAIAQTSEGDVRDLRAVQHKMMMLRRQRGVPVTVAAELQITNGQHVELAALREEISLFTREQDKTRSRNASPSKEGEISFARAADEKLNSILSDEQRQRLAQLDIQQGGAVRVVRSDFAPKLEISAAQQLRMRDAQRDILHSKGLPGPEAYATFGHACYAILNDMQRAKWKEMVGEPSEAIQCRAPLLPGPVPEPAKETTSRRIISLPPYIHLEKPVGREQLRLTDDQVAQLTEARTKYQKLAAQRAEMTGTSLERAEFTGTVLQTQRAYFALCDKILSEDQKTRLNELQFQSLCEQALLERVFREAARLSDDQINSLDRLLTAHPVATTLAPHEKLAIRQETLQLGLKYLSDSQRLVWDRMTGSPVPPESLLKVETDSVD
ncbi:MAG: hypothetical protein JWP89_6289 [Schlesneria sp.]|nr:hypothetical protein [Schlesneria sp.]